MAQIGFVDTEKDLAGWIDGPASEDLVEHLAHVAWEKAAAWAPKPLPEGTKADPYPHGYKYAQVLLIKHLWARKQAGDGEGFGADGYMIQTYPLVREAFDAIRPKQSPFAGLL